MLKMQEEIHSYDTFLKIQLQNHLFKDETVTSLVVKLVSDQFSCSVQLYRCDTQT